MANHEPGQHNIRFIRACHIQSLPSVSYNGFQVNDCTRRNSWWMMSLSVLFSIGRGCNFRCNQGTPQTGLVDGVPQMITIVIVRSAARVPRLRVLFQRLDQSRQHCGRRAVTGTQEERRPPIFEQELQSRSSLPREFSTLDPRDPFEAQWDIDP